MPNSNTAYDELEFDRQIQVSIIASSLEAQMKTANSQLDKLKAIAGTPPLDVAGALAEVDNSFQAIRRVKVLIEVLDGSLTTLH